MLQGAQQQRPIGKIAGDGHLTMKKEVMVYLLVFAVRLAPSSAGEYADDRPKPDQGKIPCRVAVCLSGQIQPVLHSMVHQSIRRNVIESIEANGCKVDVFAYPTLEDTETLTKQVSSFELRKDLYHTAQGSTRSSLLAQ